MTSFDFDLTKAQREALIQRRADLRNRANGVAWTTADLDKLKLLVLDLANLLLDDPQFSADDREFSRSLNSNGVPNAPEYRHEFLMSVDPGYFSAWAYKNVPSYAAQADADPGIIDDVNRGLAEHKYFEADPELVDRSLLRNAFREKREGESDPPEIVGKYAPRISAVLSPIFRTRVISNIT